MFFLKILYKIEVIIVNLITLNNLNYLKMSNPNTPPTAPASIAFPNNIPALPPHEKIKEFVTSIEDILCQSSCYYELLIKILNISISQGYKFYDMRPEPKLDFCANTLIRDQKKFPENSKMYYYYQAMICQFLKLSFEKINAEQEHIDTFIVKTQDAIEKFMNNLYM